MLLEEAVPLQPRKDLSLLNIPSHGDGWAQCLLHFHAVLSFSGVMGSGTPGEPWPSTRQCRGPCRNFG